jgi:hypothetical protein
MSVRFVISSLAHLASLLFRTIGGPGLDLRTLKVFGIYHFVKW